MHMYLHRVQPPSPPCVHSGCVRIISETGVPAVKQHSDTNTLVKLEMVRTFIPWKVNISYIHLKSARR